MRWTLLALALTAGACAKDKGDRISRDTTSAETSHVSATVDTATPPKTAKTGTVAETKTKPGKSMTAATVPADSAAAPASTGPTGAEAMMGVRQSGSPPPPLSGEQMKQLQVALRKDGCYKGIPDGEPGPGTQKAIACGLKKYKLAPTDTSGLYLKLGLRF
jgi:peptidoglycan hydrolase-like protein with peptidoglycan-binding domain